MSEIKVPVFSESVSEGTLLAINFKVGDSVKRGDVIAEIETDKVVLEVTATEDGVISSFVKNEGDTVLSEEVLGTLGEASTQVETQTQTSPENKQKADITTNENTNNSTNKEDVAMSPSVRRIVTENNLDINSIPATGPRSNVTKEDATNAVNTANVPKSSSSAVSKVNTLSTSRPEERVPMTRIRQKISERLKEVQNTAAILTTFNEVNMQPIMDLRKKYQEQFVAKHGIKLGFMSFFVRAATEALKAYPIVNASIDGKDIVYHGFYDVGIAVSTDRGLVVPILRNTDEMTLADIEKGISEYAVKARSNKLSIEDMSGGTFTITNGGIFGSMLSTPIINAPQSAILGMHNIVERAVVEKGQVVVRPIMYLALSYDHRIIDGRDSVQFLVKIKQFLEDPSRLLLNL